MKTNCAAEPELEKALEADGQGDFAGGTRVRGRRRSGGVSIVATDRQIGASLVNFTTPTLTLPLREGDWLRPMSFPAVGV